LFVAEWSCAAVTPNLNSTADMLSTPTTAPEGLTKGLSVAERSTAVDAQSVRSKEGITISRQP
jgi:hypothetical protein